MVRGPGRDHRGGGARRPPARSSTRRSRSSSPTSASGAWSSRGWPICCGLEERPRRRPSGPVQRLAAVLRADRRRRAGRAGVRGPAVGRLGAAGLHRLPARVVGRASRSSCSRWAARSCAGAGPGWARWSISGAARRTAIAAILDGLAPGPARGAARARSAAAPRACRCTRWRRSGCCWTAGCWSRRAPATW